jgi:5-methylcytosine-specific restriction endonuclease McrA
MVKNCIICSKEFTTYPNWIKRGGGKYCSWKCSAVAKEKEYIKRTCEICSKQFVVKPSTIKHNASRFCSHHCATQGSIGIEKPSIQGEKHTNWKNGASRQLYPLKFNDLLKERIRERDNYACQICGLQDEEHILIYNYSLMIHHIDYVKENCEDHNLIALCNQCHGRTNYNREHWIQLFSIKLKEKCNEEVI